MNLTDEQVRGEMAKWMRERPSVVQGLMRKFPPGAKVKAKAGRELLVPAPGVTGVVASWFEAGTIGVEAPMRATVTSPITGNTAEAGEVIRGECSPDDLEVVEYFGDMTPEVVAAILDTNPSDPQP